MLGTSPVEPRMRMPDAVPLNVDIPRKSYGAGVRALHHLYLADSFSGVEAEFLNFRHKAAVGATIKGQSDIACLVRHDVRSELVPYGPCGRLRTR